MQIHSEMPDAVTGGDTGGESYLENVIQEFKTLIANVEDFQNKNRENFDRNNICVPEHSLENKLPNWFTSIFDSEVLKKGTVLIVGD